MGAKIKEISAMTNLNVQECFKSLILELDKDPILHEANERYYNSLSPELQLTYEVNSEEENKKNGIAKANAK